MKLSKEEFLDMIECSRIFCIDNGYGSEREENISSALEKGTLEIEGYERATWTKFDKNDPSTYPPVGHHIIAYSPGHMSVLFRYSLATETDEQFADRFTQRYGFTHWRPLPNPPVETEASND
ncbi:MAG: hypothetical protein IKW49_01625 [Opitutales bacterium]|nr:hypothetical protein [Opitutales bacterium]